ncbi:carbonic anhydrase [Corynebacterium bovis]|nr:carbonic anhydrase [Corynebacterium bovis]MBB3115439.1 carbonic anhydrase [Corynebacterium bovis DSM 20582 = CIP 54.80]MDK8510020.1 carbonic anhydrase [Corynebacterium bovis]MDN8578626.1 carbonic anhydrase [Corynebacterium bovis]WJY78244.1 Carbonic anhydrase 2 [Corynebacterium bovis DSM 20582 = CIP 54.80]
MTMTQDLTPQQAWEMMRDGNRRFVEGDPDHPRQDVGRRTAVQTGQAPHAVVLACSDSRAPVEIIFDQGLGDVFVIRTAGEITDLSVLASLEFAVDGLGCPLVVVLGHESCGAVKAAYAALENGTMPDGFQRVLVEKVTPSLLTARAAGQTTMEQFERHHVVEIASHLIDRSPQLQQRMRDGRCGVVGMHYRLSDNRAVPVVAHGVDLGEEPGPVSEPGAGDARR